MDSVNSLYSIGERETQNGQKVSPEYDIWGNKLDQSLEFFQLPDQIGKIIGAFSDLPIGAQPFSNKEKIIRFFLWVMAGLGIWGVIFFIGSPTVFWSVVWFVIALVLAILLAMGSIHFEHINLFIGVSGFAKYVCKEGRENITEAKEVKFEDLTDVFFAQVEKRSNYTYQSTDYYFSFYDTRVNKLRFQSAGTFDKKSKIEGQPIELNFCRKIEQYWTMYLLDKMPDEIRKHGYVSFNINAGDNRFSPFIKIGPGFITFLKGGDEEIRYNSDEIKRIYSKGSDLYIEHKNFQRTLFFFKSGDADKIPMFNLSNRQFFYRALELNLGYEL